MTNVFLVRGDAVFPVLWEVTADTEEEAREAVLSGKYNSEGVVHLSGKPIPDTLTFTCIDFDEYEMSDKSALEWVGEEDTEDD